MIARDARENFFIEKREETGEGEAGGSGGMQADAKMWTAASSREPALLSSSFRRLVGYLWLLIILVPCSLRSYHFFCATLLLAATSLEPPLLLNYSDLKVDGSES